MKYYLSYIINNYCYDDDILTVAGVSEYNNSFKLDFLKYEHAQSWLNYIAV